MTAWRYALAISAIIGTGCASPGWHFGRQCVDAELAQRSGHALGPEASGGQALPADVDYSDGISEDEAVFAALWNNAAFQLLLADLGIARADIIQSRQLTNPELWTVFPVGVKQLEFAFNVPLEAIWLRPRRVKAAELESQRIGQRLVQDGLNLVRDVRLAYADVALAEDRLRLAEEGAQLRGHIAELAEARLRAGDASELEVSTIRLDSLFGHEEARRNRHDADLARQRLRLMMGLQFVEIGAQPLTPPPLPQLTSDVEALVAEAAASRPDLLSAQAAIEAANERARLARHDYLRVMGILDSNARGKKGFEAGPGVQLTVPIFNQNQGAICRAEAELQRAEKQYHSLRDTIALDIRQAHTRFLQAEEDLAIWKTEIVPVASESVASAEKAYLDGGASLFLVLETSRQLLAAKVRQVQTEADLRRAAAELDRSVGRHVTEPRSESSTELPPVPASDDSPPHANMVDATTVGRRSLRELVPPCDGTRPDDEESTRNRGAYPTNPEELSP